MTAMNRRGFLRGAAGVGLAALSTRGTSAEASEPLRLGLIGCGGRGMSLVKAVSDVEGTSITYVCDPHRSRLEAAARELHVADGRAVSDMRRLLDDPQLDAVIIATPDHWHAPAAILACDAAKHVYVEKPCSHNIREGRLIMDAARRSGKIVQHGTQCRSTAMMIAAIGKLREGIIGDVLVAKAWNVQLRGRISPVDSSRPPAELDFDLWLGPIPPVEYQESLISGGWHWLYHFGTGDMGNDGVHDIDYARWGLGVDVHPSRVSAAGGLYFLDDGREFPDTQQVTFEYPGDGRPQSRRMLIYEQRLWSTNYPHNADSGVEFYGTQGQMLLSRRGKVLVWGERNEPIDVDIAPEGQNTTSHVADFVDAIRTGRRPNANPEVAHYSTTLCHLGNIATRLGRSLSFDGAAEQIVGDEDANRLVRRTYRQDHWAVPRGV
jgi:predicted dehydrogenase